ncbi:methyltransferase [Oceaniserpentilla sp. 4NH20-0058]
MKVSLDACLFAAVCDVSNAKRVLDIGAGTGLLSLMLAQRTPAEIEGVELDPRAYQQAQQNALQSPFHNQIELFNCTIQDFQTAYNHKTFDTIICNPPFFSGQLEGPNTQRNLARHNSQLSFEDLSNVIAKFLTPTGKAWLLLPPDEQEYFNQYAKQHGLHLQSHTQIVPRNNKPSKLGIWVYSLLPCEDIEKDNITIYQSQSNEYTQKFKGYLSDYYLKL